LREGNSEAFLELFHHGDAAPWRSEINVQNFFWFIFRIWMVLDDKAACDLFDHFGKHIFCNLYQIEEISVSHVELAGCVLGVMGLID
jgi:hypothetical protein